MAAFRIPDREYGEDPFLLDDCLEAMGGEACVEGLPGMARPLARSCHATVTMARPSRHDCLAMFAAHERQRHRARPDSQRPIGTSRPRTEHADARGDAE